MNIALSYKKLLVIGLIGAALSFVVTFAFAQTTTASVQSVQDALVSVLSAYYPQVSTLDIDTDEGHEILNSLFQEANSSDQIGSLALAAAVQYTAEQAGISETEVTAYQEQVWGEPVVTALDHIEEVVQQAAEDQGTTLTSTQLLQEVTQVVSQPYFSSVNDSAGVEILQEVVTAPELTSVLTSGIEGGFDSEEFVKTEIQPAVEIAEKLTSGEAVQIGGVDVNAQTAVQAFNSGYVVSYQQGGAGDFVEEFFSQVVDPNELQSHLDHAQGASMEAFGQTVSSFAQQLGGAGGAAVAGNPAFAAMAQTASQIGATAAGKSAMAAFMSGYSGGAGGFNSLQETMRDSFSDAQKFTAQAYDPAKAQEFASQMQQAVSSGNFNNLVGSNFSGVRFDSETMRELSEHATGTGFREHSIADMMAGAQQYQQSGQGFGDPQLLGAPSFGDHQASPFYTGGFGGQQFGGPQLGVPSPVYTDAMEEAYLSGGGSPEGRAEREVQYAQYTQGLVGGEGMRGDLIMDVAPYLDDFDQYAIPPMFTGFGEQIGHVPTSEEIAGYKELYSQYGQYGLTDFPAPEGYKLGDVVGGTMITPEMLIMMGGKSALGTPDSVYPSGYIPLHTGAFYQPGQALPVHDTSFPSAPFDSSSFMVPPIEYTNMTSYPSGSGIYSGSYFGGDPYVPPPGGDVHYEGSGGMTPASLYGIYRNYYYPYWGY